MILWLLLKNCIYKMNNETEIDKITKLAKCRNKINFTLSYFKKLNKYWASYNIYNLSCVIEILQEEIDKYLYQIYQRTNNF